MKCWLPSVLLLCVTSLALPTAQAFVEDPYIIPAHPTPKTSIWVHVRMGWCHTTVDAIDGAELAVAAPGQLRLVTNGAALPPGHPFCLYPPFNFRFHIGKLPAGIYTLQLLIRDEFSAPEPIPVGSVSFTVTPLETIPSASATALILALLLLAATGALFLPLSYNK
jgi:hypothetical protein